MWLDVEAVDELAFLAFQVAAQGLEEFFHSIVECGEEKEESE